MANNPTITLAWVQEQKAKHRAALADLEATERVLQQAASNGAVTPVVAERARIFKVKPSPKERGFKKRTMLKMIEDAGGLSSQQIVAQGGHHGLKDLSIENVSPQLSGAKGDGLLVLDEGIWKLTDRGREYLAAQTN